MNSTEPSTWTEHARALADFLWERGTLQSAEWHVAFSDVPRHAFVPRVCEQDGTGTWRTWDSDDHWDQVYSPRTLVTALDETKGYPEAVSSSTNPELMARMLEVLDVRNGHRVLEIGTGTGYNAALLSRRLGDDRVFSVDVDPDYVRLARERLAEAGYAPTVVAGDGVEGLPEHGPFDRIIATCAVPTVPLAWAAQLAPGGVVLVDVKRAIGAGNLVRLRKRDTGELEGRFSARTASFMNMRHPDAEARPSTDRSSSETRREWTTAAPAQPWQSAPVLWFLAQLCGLPPGVLHGLVLDSETRQPTASTLTAPDGSHARVSLADSSVIEVGDARLWDAVEAAHQVWSDTHRPGWDRWGLTVARDGTNTAWLDDPRGEHTWTLT